jgi:hypothetical protein
MLPLIIQRFSQRYPKAILDINDIDIGTYPPNLRDHGFDLFLTRIRRRPCSV